ncbi:MAG: DNA helicase RecQ [Parvibaculaceae bacterium]|nr:DNA helicase RecQ [Parvibaculaceae bacterium]
MHNLAESLAPDASPRGLLADAHRVLRDVFGYESFRPGQTPVIEAVLAGRNVLAVMPTGAGKSLCFQVPALVRGGLTLVVSPLVALMQDQVAALRLAGVEAETINSSRSREDNVLSWRRVASGGAPLLYLAPERLMTERMIAALQRLPVSLIAVDEAHCISQWGPSFRPEYEALSGLRHHFPHVPIVALTATADETTRADIAGRLYGGEGQQFVTSFDRPNINLTVEMKQEWKKQLLRFLESHRQDSGIVYCLSRKKADETAAFLVEKGFRALPYHAGMEMGTRNRNQDIFLTDPSTIIVATIAFGMGIDKPDVRFVFHTDIPGSLEAYYQEIGRAGRDGAPADAFMLYGLDDIRLRRRFIAESNAEDDHKRREHKRLDTLIGFCEAPECRRQTLLAYFGEKSAPCGNCDVCQNPVELTDGTREAGLVIDAVAATGERYGAAHIIDILLGHHSEKIIAAGHDKLPMFGAGIAHKKDPWRAIIRQLVSSGFMEIDIGGFGGLRLTGKSALITSGESEFRYRPPVAKPQRKEGRERSGSDEPDFTSSQAALFATLKRLRLTLAQARGVPPYVIFSDKSLADMARHRPVSRAEFAEMHGVGQAKLKDLGDIFIKTIKESSAGR